MAHPIATRTIAAAPAAERVEFLKGVLTLTSVGLILTAISGFVAANVMGPYFFATLEYQGQSVLVMQHQWIYLLTILGAMIAAQTLGPKLATGNTPEIGLVVGSALMGVTLGPLLYFAYHLGTDNVPGMSLIAQALGLTALTAVGMTGYVWSKPRDFSMMRAAMAAVMLPLIVMMVLSWFLPMGGTFTLILIGGFVLVSAGTLLFELNTIIHTMDTDRKVLASVLLTLSIAVLFYNLLMLLIQLQSRD